MTVTEAAAQADAVTALDAEAGVARVVDIPAGELLAEFAKVMHEWNFVPFQRGEVRFPTLDEARGCLARTPYVCS